MDKTSISTIGATVIAGAAAESIYHTLGVICMGAFGGALFALMKMPKMQLWDGAWFMGPRFLASSFCSWLLAAVLQGRLDDLHYDVPRTALFLFVSFAVACPKELSRDLEPIWKPAVKVYFRVFRGKE